MNQMRPSLTRLDFIFTSVFVSLFSVLCGNSSAQDFKSLHPGVEYARVEHRIGSDPVKINLLRLDLTKVRLDVHHAFDKAIGVEPTSAIAKRHGAAAAINAGFFRLDRSNFAGDPSGIFMIDGRLLSESTNDRATLILTNLDKRTHVSFGHYASETWIIIGETGHRIPISGIGRERKKGEAIIYETFEHKPERQSGDVELWLGKCATRTPSRSSDRFVDCKEVGVARDEGDKPQLRSPQFIVSLEKEFVQRSNIFQGLAALERIAKRSVLIGTRVRDRTNYFAFTRNVDMTNGVPQLIKNGRIDITWQQEKASKSFAEMRHPRTAVAKLKDGRFLMMTADGRQPGVSVGMNLQELAEYLLSLGATDAMNLDGGGSTTMYFDGRVVNTPSDKEGERKVGDAIVVTLRETARR